MSHINLSCSDSALAWPINLFIHALVLYIFRPLACFINAFQLFGIRGLTEAFGLSIVCACVAGVVQFACSRQTTYWVTMGLGVFLAVCIVIGATTKWKQLKSIHTFFPGHKALV
jgi:hypothetical protein